MGSQVMHACNSHFIASQTLLIVLAEPNMWNTLMVYHTDTYMLGIVFATVVPSLCLLACYHSPLFIVYVLALSGFQLQCWLQSILQLP